MFKKACTKDLPKDVEGKMKFRESSDRLIKFIGNATCSFTTVQTSIELLRDAGFKALELGADWELERGRSY